MAAAIISLLVTSWAWAELGPPRRCDLFLQLTPATEQFQLLPDDLTSAAELTDYSRLALQTQTLTISPSSLTTPSLNRKSSEQVELLWPELGFLSRTPPAALIKQALIGTRYHPFIFAPERPRIEQERAAQALSTFDGRALLVAPGGFGKTHVAEEILRKRLTPGAHLFLSDMVLNREALLQHFREIFPEAKIVSLEQVARIAEMRTPYLVFSTTSGFNRTLRSLGPNELLNLTKKIKMVIYDEAQHSSAPVIRENLERIMSSPDWNGLLLGLTATPTNPSFDVQEFYNFQSYWPYLEQPEVRGQRRSLSDLIAQMFNAISAGDLTPFNRLLFLSQEIFGVQDLFVQEAHKLSRFVMNPLLYGTVFGHLLPLFATKNKTALIVNTISEADRLARIFKTKRQDTDPGHSLGRRMA